MNQAESHPGASAWDGKMDFVKQRLEWMFGCDRLI